MNLLNSQVTQLYVDVFLVIVVPNLNIVWSESVVDSMRCSN